MSLIAGVLENGYDMWNRTSEADQQRWIDNLYHASADLLRSFHHAQTTGVIPEANLCVVRYTDLLQNLEPTMKRILDFIEIEPSAAFVEEVRAQAEKQRSYKSRQQQSTPPSLPRRSPRSGREATHLHKSPPALAGKVQPRPRTHPPRPWVRVRRIPASR